MGLDMGAEEEDEEEEKKFPICVKLKAKVITLFTSAALLSPSTTITTI